MSEHNQNQKNRPRKNGNRNRNNRNSGNGGSGKPSQKRDELQPGRRRRPRQQPLTFWQKILKAIGRYKDPNEAKGSAEKGKPARKTGRVPGGGRVEGKGAPQKNKSGGKPRDKGETPTVVETSRLYVGNLSYDATEYDLEELFKGIGSVRNVELVYNRHTHKSKGYGFISMANVDEAKRAVEVLHDQPFMGRKMIVNGARSKGPAKGEDGGKGNNRSRDNGGGGGNRSKKRTSNRSSESEAPIPEQEEVHSLAPDKD